MVEDLAHDETAGEEGDELALALAVGADDADAGELRLRTLKGGDRDVVFMPPDVAEPLRRYVDNRRDGPLFPGMSAERLSTRQVARRLAEWSQRAGIRRVHPHGLRHAFGQALYDRTGDLLVVARAMTHRSLSSTSVYARPSEARVREAVGARYQSPITVPT